MNAAARSCVVLLAEDEEADASLVQWAFEEARIPADLRHVPDGFEALQYLRHAGPRFADAPRPDLILLDLDMPRMTGLECLALIKQDRLLRDIPVVVLTTSRDESDIAAATRLGAAGFFTKPMDVEQLAEIARMHAGCLRRLPNRIRKGATHERKPQAAHPAGRG